MNQVRLFFILTNLIYKQHQNTGEIKIQVTYSNVAFDEKTYLTVDILM